MAAAAVALAVLLPLTVLADVGPPAHMQVTETEPGRYTVQWRVPTALPARAAPVPAMPEACRPVADPTVTRQPAAWLLSQDWACDGSVAGQPIGIRYPFANLALTTVIRVDLLSGDRFAHVLSPGEGAWQVPEGTAPPDPVLGAQRAVLAGLSHALGSWVHLAFVLVLAVLGGFSLQARLVAHFTAGQLAAVALAAVLGAGLPAGAAEIGLAVGVAVLARESLRERHERRGLRGIAVASGAVHGLGLSSLLAADLGAAAGAGAQVAAVLGMDAVHVVAAGALAFLFTRVRPAGGRARSGLAYAAGAACMAFAFSVALAGSAPTEPTLDGAGLGAQTGSGPAGPAGSQRLAPSSPDAPVQSFVAVEPFEIRHEVMLRLAGHASALGADTSSILELEAQPEVRDRLVRMVLESTRVEADGSRVDPVLRRADFMTVDPTGALPRTNPVPEEVGRAVVGVVVSYPTGGMPGRVQLTWEAFPEGVEAVPATIIDPENTESMLITSERPSATWTNELLEDPIPSLAAVEIEPARLPLPWLSLPLLIVAAILVARGLRSENRQPPLALARVFLAAALLVGPVVQGAIAVPRSAGRTPSERQARRILSGLLPNVYRALEFREEGAIYDRLAVSVTGETLTEVYLEQRRALEMEERGGAQARVETVEVRRATEIDGTDDGFSVRGEWSVGGMVTHFGHRHFRQNRYDARVGIVASDGTWKIRSIEVLEQERVR